MPALLKGKMKDNNLDWDLSIFRPGDDPIGNMAKSLVPDKNSGLNYSSEEIEEKLRSDPNGLIELVKESNLKIKKNKLIVIDQFEELFRFKVHKTSFHSITDASFFVDLFLNSIHQKDVPIFVILSMRSDFLDDCTEYRNLTETINEGQYLVPKMTVEEQKLAITGPIEVFDGKISDRLTDRLINDLDNDNDQLPILQHALMRTWDYWKENRVGDQPIDIMHYEAIGTMEQALSFHAEEIYTEFPEQKDKEIIEKLFKALTDFGTDNRGTRRPTLLSEICTIANAREDDVINIIEKFRMEGRAFLMPPHKFRIDSDTTIDISHESIMRVWTRLRTWIQEETESAQLYIRLSKSAELYQHGKTGLWVNPELQLAVNWQSNHKPNPTWANRYDPSFDRAITYLEYCKKEFELEISKKENKQKRDLKRAKRFAIFLGSASLISLLFLIVSLNLKFKAEAQENEAIEQKQFAITESKKAAEQRKEAIIQKRISEQQQEIAEQQKIITEEQKDYAVRQQAIALSERAKAIKAKIEADKAKDQAIKSKEIAYEQRKIAEEQKLKAEAARKRAEESEKKTNTLRLLAIARSMAVQASKLNNTVPGPLPTLLAKQAFMFSRDNGGLENDPDIFNALLQVTEGKTVLHGHDDNVNAVDISKDGKTLISCSEDGTVKIWNIKRNENEKPTNLKTNKYGKQGFRSVRFSPDGSLIAAATVEGEILLWNSNQLSAAPEILSGHGSIVNEINFSYDSKTLASASSDGTIRMWKIDAINTKSTIIEKSTETYTSVCFSKDGKHIAFSTEKGKISLMKLSSVNFSPTIIQPSGDAILSLAFSNTGDILVSGSSKGELKLWQVENPSAKPTKLIGHASRISSICFNPNNKTLATSSYDGSIRIWNYQYPEYEPIKIDEHDSWVLSLAFDAKGDKLISSGKDKTVRIWLVNTSILSEIACNKAKRNLTIEEWNKYIGRDIKYQKTCGDYQNEK
ncbi:hypothetical protein H8E88_35595 [candidate division KSB1 bacterium]|nr:hypothetical protein [candidate division KSB1 bacterium]